MHQQRLNCKEPLLCFWNVWLCCLTPDGFTFHAMVFDDNDSAHFSHMTQVLSLNYAVIPENMVSERVVVVLKAVVVYWSHVLANLMINLNLAWQARLCRSPVMKVGSFDIWSKLEIENWYRGQQQYTLFLQECFDLNGSSIYTIGKTNVECHSKII